ncbi:uncharacterized protein LOC123504318 [Portunus trituberculatus]|uniref:Uncharacterized protein n=1 Tax=Portunus trituberculatus TaxID=210409 RepID=A0A5B7CFH4_PORTR|nr:uncharacterized protein LOC123504318 [Portunus trituberculatus]MPC08177.1 hypothetical protein [Portunus trituberculatus]
MLRTLLAVAAVVMVAVHTTSAAPRDFNSVVNDMLHSILDKITEPVKPSGPIELRIKQNHVADVYLRMDDCEITGLKDFVAHDSTITLYGIGKANISISIKSPKVTLTTGHYFINGTMVDHVELYGNGPGLISVDEMDVKVEGSANVLGMEFTEATLDLEMWRWTVALEDLMPGTDLGTVFNEFFSMYGPEIFDIVENNINKNGKLVGIINNLIKQYLPGRIR